MRDVYVFSYFCVHILRAHVHKYTSKIDCSKEVYISLLYSVIYQDFICTVEFLDASRISIEKPLLFTYTNITFSGACCCIGLIRDKNGLENCQYTVRNCNITF